MSTKKYEPDFPDESDEMDGPLLQTQQEIANSFSVHIRTIATWIGEGMPKPPVRRSVVEIWCYENERGQFARPAGQRPRRHW